MVLLVIYSFKFKRFRFCIPITYIKHSTIFVIFNKKRVKLSLKLYVYHVYLFTVFAKYYGRLSQHLVGQSLWLFVSNFLWKQSTFKENTGKCFRLPISRGFCAIMPHHLLLSVHSQRHTEQEIRGRQTSRNDTCKQQVELRLFRYLGAASRLRDWKTTVGECWEAEMRQVNQF